MTDDTTALTDILKNGHCQSRGEVRWVASHVISSIYNRQLYLHYPSSSSYSFVNHVRRLTRLVSWPPDVVVGLLWGVEDKLAAGVHWAIGPGVGGDVVHDHVGDLDSGVVTNPDTETSAVKTRWVDAGSEPETVL